MNTWKKNHFFIHIFIETSSAALNILHIHTHTPQPHHISTSMHIFGMETIFVIHCQSTLNRQNCATPARAHIFIFPCARLLIRYILFQQIKFLAAQKKNRSQRIWILFLYYLRVRRAVYVYDGTHKIDKALFHCLCLPARS